MAIRLRTDLTGFAWAGASAVLVSCGLVLLVRRYDAPLVLAALVSVGAAVPLVIWPDVATLVVVFLLYTNIPVVARYEHGMPQFIAGSFVMLLALPLVHYLLFRRQRPKVDRVFGLMLCFFGVMLLSALFSRDKGLAFERIQTYVLEGLVLYWLVINAVRRLPTLRRVIWTLLAAGSLLGGLSMYQSLTGSYTQQFGGLVQRQSRIDPGKVDVRAPRDISDLQAGDRAGGPMLDTNRYAQILIVLLPLAVLRFRSGRSRRARLCAGAAGIFILSGMALSYSRGAILTLALMLVAAALIGWVRPIHIATGLVCAAMLVPFVAPGLYQRIATLGATTDLVWDDPSVKADGSIRSRATEMLAAYHAFLDHPILGVGPGLYGPVYSETYHQIPEIKYREIRKSRRAHTLYFEMAAETGVIGLAVFLSIPLVLLRELWRARRRWAHQRPEHFDMATAFWLGIVGYLGTALFLHLSYERYYWLLLAMAGTAISILRTEGLRGGSSVPEVVDESMARRRSRHLLTIPSAT